MFSKLLNLLVNALGKAYARSMSLLVFWVSDQSQNARAAKLGAQLERGSKNTNEKVLTVFPVATEELLVAFEVRATVEMVSLRN